MSKFDLDRCCKNCCWSGSDGLPSVTENPGPFRLVGPCYECFNGSLFQPKEATKMLIVSVYPKKGEVKHYRNVAKIICNNLTSLVGFLLVYEDQKTKFIDLGDVINFVVTPQ